MRVFETLVETAMISNGFSRVPFEPPSNEDAVVLQFEKDGAPTWVTATGCEIMMNSSKEPMIAMVKARVKSATVTWKNNKAHG